MSLDQWAGQESAGAAAKNRELLEVFKKEWRHGHESNPLLFPMDLPPAAWKDQFGWFVEMETFFPAGGGPAAEVAPGPEIPAVKSGADLEAGTMILEAETKPSSPDDLKTVVVDRMPFSPPQPPLDSGAATSIGDTGPESGGLEDLGTLILESQEAVKKPASIETPPAESGPVNIESGELEIELSALVIEDETSGPRKEAVGSGASAEEEKFLKKEGGPTEKPGRPEAEKKKTDTDLDLADLETMEWQDK